MINNDVFVGFQAQSDDDDVADDVSVNVGGQDDFMTEFFAEVSTLGYFGLADL